MKYILLFALFLFNTAISAQIPAQLSNAEKIYGLSRFWQEVNCNFVYLDKVDRKAWDEGYIQLIEEVQQTTNDYEYYRLLEKFCAYLKDGHTNIYMPESLRNKITGTDFGDYRIFLSNIEGKAIVTAVNKNKRNEIPVGSEIVKVNGIPVKTHINENVKPYISSSTEHILEDWGVSRMLEGVMGTTLNIEFRTPGNKMRSLSLTRTKAGEHKMVPDLISGGLLEYRWLDKNTGYLSLNSFSDEKINEIFLEKLPEISRAKKLVIDLRKNGGGNTNIGVEILKYFVKDSLLYGSRSYTRKHNAAMKAWGGWVSEKDTVGNTGAAETYLAGKDLLYHEFDYQPWKIGKPEINIVVPTVILFGHNTASAAEDFLIFTENQEHIITIGQPSFGSTGQPYFFELPNGAAARICTKKDTYPDGREFVGYGIQPDIFVRKKLEDFINNEDPALEEAKRYLLDKKS